MSRLLMLMILISAMTGHEPKDLRKRDRTAKAIVLTLAIITLIAAIVV